MFRIDIYVCKEKYGHIRAAFQTQFGFMRRDALTITSATEAASIVSHLTTRQLTTLRTRDLLGEYQ